MDHSPESGKTTLDLMADGILLNGAEYFAKMDEVVKGIVRYGLHRGVAASWRMSAEPAQSAREAISGGY